MPDATITSTASTFGTITGTFAADQSTVTGTITGVVAGTLTGSVGVPGPAGPTGPQGPEGPPGPPGVGGTWGSITGTLSSQTDLQTALNLKANLESPSLTGNPTAPTATFGDNDTTIATTAFVQAGLLGGTANARNLEVYVRNQSGSTIPAGSIVYISGATGNRPLITLAQANNDANSAQTMGFTKTAISNNGFGYVIVRGELENIDTSALTEGVQLYLSPTTAGTWTTTKPSAPQHLVYVGIVVRAHPTQGVILVAVQNGYELNELHDVKITSVANGQVLKYDSAQGLWVNGTDSAGVAWGGITGTLSSQTDLQSALDGKYSTSNPSGYITSSALTPYLTSATAALTYQTISGMSSYLTTGTAASTYQTISGMSSYLTTADAATSYYPLSGNPSGFLTSASLSGYATESWVTSFNFATESWVSTNFAQIESPTFTGTVTIPSGASISGYLTTSSAASTYAPIASPALTGNPTAPTPATSDNDTSIATTAFVKAQGYLTSAPVTSVAGKTGAVTLVNTDISGLGTMATANTADYSTTTVANGLYYPLSSNPAGYLTSAPVTSVAGRTGAVTLAVADVSGAAPLASPALTGTPTAPTATAGTNTTQLATTAFVQQEVPAASTTAAGKVELATVAESHAGTSTTLVPTPFGIQFAMAQGMSQRMDFLNTTAVSGSGAVTSFLAGFREVFTNAISSAGRAAFFLGGQSGTTYTVFGSNANEVRIDFSKKIWMAGRFSTATNSTYVGDANCNALITLGGYTGFATGNMTSLGIGLRKAGGTSSVVQLIVHNGTTFTSVNTTKTLAIREQTDYMIYSDGAGNVSLYIEGALAASTSSGPTGITADFGGIYREQVEQTASAAVRYSLHCYGGYLCLE
jgi:hypothetical protein